MRAETAAKLNPYVCILMRKRNIHSIASLADRAGLDSHNKGSAVTRKLVVKQSSHQLSHNRMGPVLRVADALGVRPSVLMEALWRGALEYDQANNISSFQVGKWHV